MKGKSRRTVVSEEESVLPDIYADNRDGLEVQTDNGGGQGLGEGLRQQAGSILKERYTATSGGIVVVMRLILVARLGGVVACALLVLFLGLNMNLACRCCIAEAEGEAV